METDLTELDQTCSNISSLCSSPLFKKSALRNVKKRLQDLTTLSDLDDDTISYIDTKANLSAVNETLYDVKPNVVSNLYMEFFEVWQTHHNDLLENVKQVASCCFDSLSILKQVSEGSANEKLALENEYNTWCLLNILYTDRLHTQLEDEVPQYFGLSEKLCASNLFKRDNLVRESQLVIDWLEAASVLREDDILQFRQDTVGWENTLHELKSKDTIAFASTRPIVDRLDPDAPNYQRLPLHDLDMEDDKHLCQRVFQEIRCGKLSEAQKFCVECGHGWRAALLEGWRLHHNPVIVDAVLAEDVEKSSDGDVDSMDKSEEIDKPEGNEVRDAWKVMAFEYCQEPHLDPYEKAAIGAYCGNLQSMLAIGQNWEDHLWAYMKVMIDIRVESEIRDCVNKDYLRLSDGYWDQRMSLNDVFLKLQSSRKEEVADEATNIVRVIQKYIILEDIEKLFSYLDEMIQWEATPTPLLRFLVHLILFLDQVGSVNRRDVVEKVLELYISRLADMNETQLVAFYVSKLNSQSQVEIFASYLEHILENEPRKDALMHAEYNGLNIFATTKQVVENIRRKPHEVEACGELQAKLTENDELKISALDWVLFYESQRLEALLQSNALIFTFLTLKKLDAAQLAFNKIPANTVEYILSEGSLGEDANLVIKEHLSYKAYLDAQTAFNSWFKQFNMKPLPPQSIPESAQFTEKVAYQHRVSQFKAESERWKLTMTHLTRTTKTFLYNVLLFPDGGWLSGAKDCDFLRSLCIPECVLLLYNVLSESNLHEECVQLADILAAEKYGLYKVYTQEKLAEILMKLSEISVALLNEKKDPWGNPTSN